MEYLLELERQRALKDEAAREAALRSATATPVPFGTLLKAVREGNDAPSEDDTVAAIWRLIRPAKPDLLPGYEVRLA